MDKLKKILIVVITVIAIFLLIKLISLNINDQETEIGNNDSIEKSVILVEGTSMILDEKIDSEVKIESSNGNVTIYDNKIIANKVGETTVTVTKNNEIIKVYKITIESEDSSSQIEEPKSEINKKTSFKVTFVSNGGSSVKNKMVYENETVEEPGVPIKEGYIFAGWYLNDIKYNFNTPVTSNIILTAKWKEDTLFDREPPSGSCDGYYSASENISYITIKANDNVGILKYVFNNKDYVTDKKTYKITVNGGVNTTHLVSIKIYDTSNNMKEIQCQLVHNGVSTMSVISDNDVKNKVDKKYLVIDKSTMKVWMEHKNITIQDSKKSDFYLTYIWLKDPYNQIKTQVANDKHNLDKFNNYRETYQEIPSSTLNDAISENSSLKSKSLIAINASSQSAAMVNPYYIKNGITQTILTKDSENNTYDDTTRVVYNYRGKKITANSHIVYSITSKGYLKFYEKFEDGKNVAANKNIYNEMRKTDEIKYTFSFNPVYIKEGKIEVSTKTNPTMRQVLCQVDKNNFIILTSNYTVSKVRPVANDTKTDEYENAKSKGLSHWGAAKELEKLGCTTAVNLDGGGSVALILKKDKNIKVISGDNRVTPDILYFHE